MSDYLKDFEERIQKRSNEELRAMLSHSEDYAPEALEIIRKETMRRGETQSLVLSLPNEELARLVTSPKESDPPDLVQEARNEAARRGGLEAIRQKVVETEIIASGKFRKVKVRPILRPGQYRGEGIMQAGEEGLFIQGRHVLSMGARWGIGLAIFFGFLLITLAASGGGFYFAPGLIPLYFLMEYGILKRENLKVPYSDIHLYSAVPSQNLIGIEFRGDPYCSPVAMRTDQWKEIYDILQKKVPGASATLAKILPMSKGKVIRRSVFVFLGWYLLFSFLWSMILAAILASTGAQGIPGVKNAGLRIFLWVVSFLIPIGTSFLLTRRYYRKKRRVVV